MEGLDSMSYLFDGTLFWERHVRELIEGYKQEGRMISQAPDGLIILLPPGVIARTLINLFELEYALYGNDLADEDFYELLLKIYEDNIKKYPDHIGGDPDYTDCDWLNTNKLMADTGINKDIPQISDQVFTSVTFACFYRMMAKYAEILGKNDDQSRFKASFRHSVDQIEKILVDGDNGLKNASQGAYGMMLHFNTINAKNEHLLEQKLKEIIERNDCRFATGVYTVGSLIRALSAHKMHDLAYKMMTDDRCPSFKYMMDEGSQTIWERWDTRMPELPYLYEKPRWQQQNKTQTIIVENGIEDCSMNSFDHIEFTTVTPWITEYVFGLRTNVNDGPAMKHFTFKTESITENKSAKGHFDTIRGKIEISWRINNKTFECKINIPANMKCTFCIPDEFENVTVNNKDEENMKIELGSGRYYIKAEKLF